MSNSPSQVTLPLYSVAHPAFTVFPGDGPAPKGHLFRHPDGFVCLRLDSPEPSRAHLRVADESYEPDPIPEEPSEYPRF